MRLNISHNFAVIYIGLDKQNFRALNCKYFLTHQFSHNVLGTQKNNLIELVLLSTHNIYFD